MVAFLKKSSAKDFYLCRLAWAVAYGKSERSAGKSWIPGFAGHDGIRSGVCCRLRKMDCFASCEARIRVTLAMTVVGRGYHEGRDGENACGPD